MWMERKVTEWGCMQALIDFDGWRKWKEYAKAKEAEDPAKKAAEEKEEKAKAKAALKAMFARPPPGGSSTTKKPEKKDEKKEGQVNGVPGKQERKGSGSALQKHKSRMSSGSASGGTSGSLKGVMEEEEGMVTPK